MSKQLALWIGKAIAVLWACFWTWFAFASSGGIGPSFQQGVPVWISAILLISAALAGAKPLAGGPLLIVEGCALAAWYMPLALDRQPIPTIVFVLGTFVVPPIVAGALLCAVRTKPRSGEVVHS